MMVLTFTDGKNTESGSVADVRKTIEQHNFFPQNNCFFAIAGVGDASESCLREICAGGYGLYTHTNDISAIFNLFQLVVQRIAVQVGARFTRVDISGLRVEQLQAFARAYGCIFPMDYILNLDRSGSMGPSSGCFISTSIVAELG
jgi:hypothetical protein